MAIDRRLLAIIGRRIPAIYDVIPRGPLSHLSRVRFSEVALNPQPLPPHELGAAIAGEFVHTAWLADRLGLDLGLAFNDLDDWCPTAPKKLKLPPWWPPIPEPDPHPEWLIDLHLGFAARLAVVSVDVEGTRLGEALNKAIERSVAAIDSANT
jgi:hypothetical protein